MSVLLDKLIAKKEYWTQIGFTYGQMIIDFVYMYENNLDIYFDRDNPRVCSYKKQLIELLGSDSEQLILMVHCEAEKSFGGSKYDNLFLRSFIYFSYFPKSIISTSIVPGQQYRNLG